MDVARPLAKLLQDNGLKVWFDEYSLVIGDNLRQSIEHGLAESRFGIVILSPDFFAKKWPQLELDGMFVLERPGKKKILPVWHNVTAADVEQFSSFLAMRLGVSTSAGLDHVVANILRAVGRDTEAEEIAAETKAGTTIHPHSIHILQAATESDGRISMGWYLAGLGFGVGNTMKLHDAPRTIALLFHCVGELTALGFLEQTSESMYELTQEGYDFVPPANLIDAPRPVFPVLTSANHDVAVKIMRAAVSGNGRVYLSCQMAGWTLSAGAVNWEASDDRRQIARWRSVLDELQEKELLSHDTGQAFLVSHLGYLWTDKLNAELANNDSDTHKGGLL